MSIRETVNSALAAITVTEQQRQIVASALAAAGIAVTEQLREMVASCAGGGCGQ